MLRLREKLWDFSKGDGLWLFWRLHGLYSRAKTNLGRGAVSFFMNRSARSHGGYVGPGASFGGVPSLPHGLHGVYISRYARIGAGCRIYQNVTIGEVGGKAPVIGDNCLIGAGAVVVGDIRVGSNVKIGAGAAVFSDVPEGRTVVCQPPRILKKEEAGCER